MKRDFGSECVCVCMCVLVNTHKLVIYKKKIIIRALKGMELNPFFFLTWFSEISIKLQNIY